MQNVISSWYVSKGKFEEIKKSIQTISEVNGKNPEFRIIDQFIVSHLLLLFFLLLQLINLFAMFFLQSI